MTIQEQLTKIMQEKGITKYQLAKDTSLDDSQLSKFFNYKTNLSFKKIEEITEYLDCEILITPKCNKISSVINKK